MADKSSHSPSPGLNGQGDDKPRLTEEEKKQNHIASGTCRSQETAEAGHSDSLTSVYRTEAATSYPRWVRSFV